MAVQVSLLNLFRCSPPLPVAVGDRNLVNEVAGAAADVRHPDVLQHGSNAAGSAAAYAEALVVVELQAVEAVAVSDDHAVDVFAAAERERFAQTSAGAAVAAAVDDESIYETAAADADGADCSGSEGLSAGAAGDPHPSVPAAAAV